jgi:DNA mismatch repair protein MutS2
LAYVANFPHLEFLEKDIHKVIAPDLTIYDNASPKLKSVRLAITHLENEMKKKLGFVLDANKVYLSDTTLTIKNGHYVLPVANAYKNKVKGIVQDVSGSGETTFIEPEVLVEMNNKMVELRNDEREEIRRLLAELSSEIASVAEPVLLNNKMIGYLDFVQAKALYADETKSHVAKMVKEPTIDLQNARHPLIDPKKVVANDFRLNEKTSLIVISGPNAGGKTVALKTLGICVLMSQSGLAIPCDEGATLSYFKHIYVDIGDSQSLSDNLSTFSGHMANIASILTAVGGRDLVLLDEVGTGTSPKEGEAIAFAVISY